MTITGTIKTKESHCRRFLVPDVDQPDREDQILQRLMQNCKKRRKNYKY
jgi:hypothetical protein